MRIKPQSGIQTRTEAADAAKAAEQAKARKESTAAATSSVPRTDTVEISGAGREIAARSQSASLTPERSARIRQNVLEGAYNSLAVVDEVARRILGSGDLA